MVNQQLVDYIKQQLQGGVQKDAVKKALLDAGWPAADVDDSLKTLDIASPSVAPVATTVNPSSAMAGMNDLKTAEVNIQGPKDNFFSPSPAEAGGAKAGSSKIIMIVMGVVIVILLGALGYLYMNAGGDSVAQLNLGTPDSGELTNIQAQLLAVSSEKETLNSQLATLTAEKDILLNEVKLFVPGSGTSTEVGLKGTLNGNTGAYVLTTTHGLSVPVRNSKDVKLEAILKPLIGKEIELSGTRKPGVAEIYVEMVNGASINPPPTPVAPSTPASAPPAPTTPPAGTSSSPIAP